MCGVFARFERRMIVERVKAGLARARAEGKTLGRPRISAAKEAQIREQLKAGQLGIHKVAKLVGVGSGTVQRIRENLKRSGGGRSREEEEEQGAWNEDGARGDGRARQPRPDRARPAPSAGWRYSWQGRC
jgi:DNA invertase Pin-like site-specific DNA recombinase